jgi:hypothetical protein
VRSVFLSFDLDIDSYVSSFARVLQMDLFIQNVFLRLFPYESLFKAMSLISAFGNFLSSVV